MLRYILHSVYARIVHEPQSRAESKSGFRYLDRDPCSRAGRTCRLAKNRLAATHRSDHAIPRRRRRKAPLVRPALEDRGVSQDLEIGLPGRRRKAHNHGAPREADLGLLHSELAGVLNDHDQSARPESLAQRRFDQCRNRTARSARARQTHRQVKRRSPPTWPKSPRLGGYLARASDPPPDNAVMWRGLSRLTDIKLGAITFGAGLVGNWKFGRAYD